MFRRTLALVSLALCCVFLSSEPAFAARLPPAASRLVEAVNAARSAHGVPSLQLDAALTRAARAHSRDMLAQGYFRHGDFERRMTVFHVPGSLMGENLAWGNGRYAQAASIVQQWLASPEHRANLLDPRFARVGIGVVRGSFLGAANAMVVTADFAG